MKKTEETKQEVVVSHKPPTEKEELEHLYMLMQRHKVTQIGQVEVRLANLKS